MYSNVSSILILPHFVGNWWATVWRWAHHLMGNRREVVGDLKEEQRQGRGEALFLIVGVV